MFGSGKQSWLRGLEATYTELPYASEPDRKMIHEATRVRFYAGATVSSPSRSRTASGIAKGSGLRSGQHGPSGRPLPCPEDIRALAA
jgi:hypothetical protein